MKKLLSISAFSFLLSGLASSTPVEFPLLQMFGGNNYTKSFRVDAVNPTVTDGTNFWVGSYLNVTPVGGTNPIVDLTPNDYLVTFQDSRTPWRIRVANTTNLQNAVTETIGPMPSFWWSPNPINLTQNFTNYPSTNLNNGKGTNVDVSGTFSGSGTGLTNLDASQITSGKVPSAALNGGQNNTYLAQMGYSLEQFGGSPMKTLIDAYTTNGSRTIYSASGNFTSSDIGKWAAVYTDTYNTNYNLSIITNVPSSHELELSNACTATASLMTLNYGFDNVSNFQAMIDAGYSNGIHNYYLSNAPYMLVGSLQYSGTNCYSLIHFPQPSSTSGKPVFEFDITGASPQKNQQSGFFNYSVGRNGTILYCPTKQLFPTNCNVFGLASSNNTFTAINVHFKNIMFLQPQAPQLSWFDNRHGGGFYAAWSCAEVDYSAGKINSVIGGHGATVLKCAYAGANGEQILDNFDCSGYDVGVETGEHTKIICGTFSANRVGFYLNQSAIFEVVMPELVNNSTNIFCDPNAAYVGINGSLYNETASLPANTPTIVNPKYASSIHNLLGHLNVFGDPPLISDGSKILQNPLSPFTISWDGGGIYHSSIDAFGSTGGLMPTRLLAPNGMIAPSNWGGTNDWNNYFLIGSQPPNLATQPGLWNSSAYKQLFINYTTGGILNFYGGDGIYGRMDGSGLMQAKSFGIYGGSPGKTGSYYSSTNSSGNYTEFQISGGIVTNVVYR